MQMFAKLCSENYCFFFLFLTNQKWRLTFSRKPKLTLASSLYSHQSSCKKSLQIVLLKMGALAFNIIYVVI